MITTNPISFSIVDATLEGYRFLFRNWRYLATIGIVPFIAEVATVLFMRDMLDSKNSALSHLMIALPSICMAGWFMFVAFRLAVLGERADKLPKDRNLLIHRGRLMWASIILWMLFNMGVMFCAMLILSATKILQAGPNPIMTFINIFTIGFCFWAARLGVLHFLAAVDYPIKAYIRKVRGFGVSARLLGLGLLCVLPCGFAQQALMIPFMPKSFPDAAAISGTAKTLLLVFSAVFSVAMTSIMAGACASALKQMLGDRRA